VMEFNIWLGVPEITTPVHYDLPHNFYVQLYGRKRFLLFAPDQWKYLYLYPRIHPSSRMSQVDWEDSSRFENDYPMLQYLRPPMEVVLYPGDMLYIPPYWGHHVIAVDLSISLSTHIKSSEVTIRNQVLDFPFPFEPNLEQSLRHQYVASYIELLLEGDQTPTLSFLEKMLERRWRSLPLDKYVVGLTEAMAEVKMDFSFHKDIPVVVKHKLKDHAAGIKYALARYNFEKCHFAEEKREIELSNYIEDVISFVLGPVNVGPYLEALVDELGARQNGFVA